MLCGWEGNCRPAESNGSLPPGGYDTVDLHAQKLTRWPASSSARHRREKQKPSSSEETVRAIVGKGSPGETGRF